MVVMDIGPAIAIERGIIKSKHIVKADPWQQTPYISEPATAPCRNVLICRDERGRGSCGYGMIRSAKMMGAPGRAGSRGYTE